VSHSRSTSLRGERIDDTCAKGTRERVMKELQKAEGMLLPDWALGVSLPTNLPVCERG